MLDFILDSNSTVCFSDGRSSVGQILNRHKRLTQLLKREVVFVLLPRSELAIQLYISLLCSKSVPLFLPDQLAPHALSKLISQFRPGMLIIPECLDTNINDYSQIYDNASYKLLRRNEVLTTEIDPNLCMLASTSGSTGNPKLVPQTFDNIICNTEQIIDALDLCSGDVALASLPLSYTFGMSVVNCQLMTGGGIVASNFNLFDGDTLRSISANNVNVIAGVPTHFEQMLNLRFFKSKYAKSVTKYLQAGGALKGETQKRLVGLKEQVSFHLYRMYGQAEATTRISVSHPEADTLSIGCVGVPLKGLEVLIDNAFENAKESKCVGEICCRGPNICAEYVQDFSALSKLKPRKDNLLRTGDLGYLSSQGELFITGRLKRVAKLRGISFNLDDIENSIYSATDNDVICVEILSELVVFLKKKHDDQLKITIEKVLHDYGIHDFKLVFRSSVPMLSNGKVAYQVMIDRYIG